MKKAFIIASLLVFLGSFAAPIVLAQVPAANINDTGFRLVICDGPAGANINHDQNYVPCDFQHLMMQAQYLINVMIVLGVVAALIGFAYAGILYISGNPEKIKRATGIFPKVFWGFILMLTAWFIVYQILSWLTGHASSYLGSG